MALTNVTTSVVVGTYSRAESNGSTTTTGAGSYIHSYSHTDGFSLTANDTLTAYASSLTTLNVNLGGSSSQGNSALSSLLYDALGSSVAGGSFQYGVNITGNRYE